MKITNQAEYDAAKIELKLKEENSIAQCCIHVTADMIRADLLEYRRQNNIFEVGDWVVNVDGISDNDVYTVKEKHGNFIVGDNGGSRGFWILFIEEIRHATDAEIKANRCLDLHETVVQSLGEVS